MEKQYSKNSCRICLTECNDKRNKLSIYDKGIYPMMIECFSFKMVFGYEIALVICDNCHSMLDKFFQFKIQAVESNQRLHIFIKNRYSKSKQNVRADLNKSAKKIKIEPPDVILDANESQEKFDDPVEYVDVKIQLEEPEMKPAPLNNCSTQIPSSSESTTASVKTDTNKSELLNTTIASEPINVSSDDSVTYVFLTPDANEDESDPLAADPLKVCKPDPDSEADLKTTSPQDVAKSKRKLGETSTEKNKFQTQVIGECFNLGFNRKPRENTKTDLNKKNAQISAKGILSNHVDVIFKCSDEENTSNVTISEADNLKKDDLSEGDTNDESDSDESLSSENLYKDGRRTWRDWSDFKYRTDDPEFNANYQRILEEMKKRIEENNLECFECNNGRIYHSRCTFKNHIRTHTGFKPHVCTFCQKKFSTVGKFRIHEAKHRGVVRVTCTECDKGFFTTRQLKVHMLTHSEERPFKCPTCGKGYKNSYTVRTHMRSHSSEKRFTCDICPKGFSYKVCLIDHRKRHFGEKDYLCNECGHTCYSNSELGNHMKQHRNGIMYKCPFPLCTKEFITQTRLNAHKKSTHTGRMKPNFSCSECFKGFSTEKQLNEHSHEPNHSNSQCGK